MDSRYRLFGGPNGFRLERLCPECQGKGVVPMQTNKRRAIKCTACGINGWIVVVDPIVTRREWIQRFDKLLRAGNYLAVLTKTQRLQNAYANLMLERQRIGRSNMTEQETIAACIASSLVRSVKQHNMLISATERAEKLRALDPAAPFDKMTTLELDLIVWEFFGQEAVDGDLTVEEQHDKFAFLRQVLRGKSESEQQRIIEAVKRKRN